MPKRKLATPNTSEEVLRDILIVQLGLAGVPVHDIRKIAGVALERVTRVTRHLKKTNA